MLKHGLRDFNSLKFETSFPFFHLESTGDVDSFRGEGQVGSRARTACPFERARDTEGAGGGASLLGET